MPKPPGWKTLATDLPQEQAYRIARLLERITGKEGVRASLARLLERTEKEIKDFERAEQSASEWIDIFCPDIEYSRGKSWNVPDAWMQSILDAWQKAQDRAFNAEKELREVDKKWDDLVALCTKQIEKVGELCQGYICDFESKYQKLWTTTKALMAENQELRRKLARYEEPRQ